MVKYIDGDLIKLAEDGHFDVIAHGCNCFCTMSSGIAPQMAKAFGCDKFPGEYEELKGNINKLGSIDYQTQQIFIKQKINVAGVEIESTNFGGKDLTVINAYTQYRYGHNHADGDSKPVDYVAIALCMRKINHIFKGKVIGLPLIGAGLAGGDWNVIEKIIQKELKDMDVTIVKFKNK